VVGQEWGWLVSGYLFLVGIGSGAYLTSSAADFLGGDRYKYLAKTGFAISVPVTVLGTLLLLLDLGRPERFMNVFSHPETSMLSLGSYLLGIFIPVALATAVVWSLVPTIAKPVKQGILIVGSVLAFGVAIYVGLLLGAAFGRPFWYSPVLPWLLFVSSLVIGLAGSALVATVSRSGDQSLKEVLITINRNDVALILLEVVALVAYLGTVAAPGPISALLSGSLSVPFYIGVLLAGMIAPLGVGVYARILEKNGAGPNKALMILSFILLLIGGLSLRTVIVFAGQV